MTPRRIFTLPAQHCELNGPNRVRLSPLSVAVRTVKPLSDRTRCCAWLLPACPGSCPNPIKVLLLNRLPMLDLGRGDYSSWQGGYGHGSARAIT